jgi:hypothetical protein
MFLIQNKKYQNLKVFISESESVVIEPKSAKRINIPKLSKHIEDLQEAGLISVKKV